VGIKVIINGAGGKMGKEAVKAVKEDSSLELVAENHRGDNLAKNIELHQADIVVDLTTASAVFENVTTIIETGARPVVGTSGLLPDQVNQLKEKCINKKLGGIIAPNFSIGAILMMKYAQDAARHLPNVEIIELHHDKKEDSPSGTAIKTSEMIAETRKKIQAVQSKHETIPGARGADNFGIPIHSVRLPGIFASQQVIFGNEGETLTISNQCISRAAMMPGIILACKKVMGLDTLIYGLEHII